jgi:hypothetical protein
VTDVSEVAETVESLHRLPVRPTARIVFDGGVPPGAYVDAVRAIHGAAWVMGELLDSEDVVGIGLPDYLERARRYLDALGDDVDLWEMGNEINGEWLGDSATVVAKVQGALELARARGKATAITLHYNEGCSTSADHELFTWVNEQLRARVRDLADYVLLSYYEDHCAGEQPVWPIEFERLAAAFPRARLGFGECGTEHGDRKAEYVQRYYSMRVPVPRYVGGYFWWYFSEDMVPPQKPLWGVLRASVGK